MYLNIYIYVYILSTCTGKGFNRRRIEILNSFQSIFGSLYEQHFYSPFPGWVTHVPFMKWVKWLIFQEIPDIHTFLGVFFLNYFKNFSTVTIQKSWLYPHKHWWTIPSMKSRKSPEILCTSPGDFPGLFLFPVICKLHFINLFHQWHGVLMGF